MVDLPRFRSDIDVVSVGDEQIVWDPVLERIHRLDAIGATLAPFLDGATSEGELAADVAEVWSVALDVAAAAVRGLVEQLDAAGLLVANDVTPMEDQTELGSVRYLKNPPAP